MSATMNTDTAAVAEIFLYPTAVRGLSDDDITQFSAAGQTNQLERAAEEAVASAPSWGRG